MRTVGTVFAGFAAVGLLAATDMARAQTAPNEENGRYTLSATDNGYLRLDTRTGAVSICTPKGGWVCRAVPDERAALDQEIGRLQRQVDGLKTQLASRDAPRAQDEPSDKAGSSKKSATEESAAGESSVSPQDKLTAMLDRVWRHLVEMASRVQKKLSDII